MLVPLGAVLALVLGSRILAGSGHEPLWKAAGVVTLLATAFTAWWMWRLRRWALWMSWLLAVGALVIGGAGAHFIWSFRPFEEPTVWERARGVILHLPVMASLICPLIWLAYFTRPAVRARFRGTSQGGFVSFNLWIGVAWLFIYGWTGYLAGLRMGHPWLGALLGLGAGVVPAGQLGVGAHYGGWVALLALPFALTLLLVSEAHRLWLGLAFCAIPWVLVLVGLAVDVLSKRGKNGTAPRDRRGAETR